MPIRERREVTMSNGQHPIVGTDKAAREDALKRVVDFLEANAVGQ
jgi:hypothetical protein